MRSARLRIYNRRREPIGETEITERQVLEAMERYDSECPLNDYPRTDQRRHIKTWLQNGNFDFAVRHSEGLYPPKHILRSIIDPGQTRGLRFIGGVGKGDTNSVFEELGFEVVPKPEALPVNK